MQSYMIILERMNFESLLMKLTHLDVDMVVDYEINKIWKSLSETNMFKLPTSCGFQF
jgi:hypothetical protein